MPHASGRWVAMSMPRRFVSDMLHFAQKVPLCTMQRTMHLAPVSAARARSTPRPGWCALFVKAYGTVAARQPLLRRVYMRWPWPHFYEHPENIASVTIGRRLGDEDAVFVARIPRPQERSLADLEERLHRYKTAPLHDITQFRTLMRISRLPWPLRRLLWWLGLNAWGAHRARTMGTFAVSVTAGLGAIGLRPLSPLTTILSYGMVDADGAVDVRVTYDHRVMDGVTVGQALVDLEEALNGSILAELRGMAQADAA
jgi:hypothetical protein